MKVVPMKTATIGRTQNEPRLDGIADVVTRADVEDLVAPRNGPCVSLFLPTHRGAIGTDQDRIRLKNLIEDADAALVARGLREPSARRMLAPASALDGDALFWDHCSEGLALFLAPDRWRAYRFPMSVPSRAVVGPRFQVRPLLPLLSDDGRFYVLALSQNGIRLLLGTRDRVHEVPLSKVPRSLQSALRYDDPQKERQFHISIREGDTAAISHGHGIGGEVDKERIGRYLNLVDTALSAVLRDERAPLVLAGADYERAIYRSVTTYPMVLEEGIHGSPDRIRSQVLHRRAWPLVEPIFQRARKEAAARYRRLEGTGRTTADLEEVLRAADRGRVDVLFVWTDAERWGSVDETTGHVTVSVTPSPDDEDLLELAAVRTMLCGGTVYAVPSQGMPNGVTLAAILRF
jgi:hypothetical protein